MSLFSDYAGGRRVEATHSPTAGFLKDVQKAGLALNNIATDTVFKIIDRWASNFKFG